MTITPEPVFNLIMAAIDNGLDYALSQSEYAQEQDDEELERLIESYIYARERIIERLTTLSNDASVVQLAWDGGTDDYVIDSPEEFSVQKIE